MRIDRRRLLQSGLSLPAMGLCEAKALPRQDAGRHEKLLLVISAGGGASLVDSFLPVVSSAENTGIRSYSPGMIESVPGSAFLTVKPYPYTVGKPSNTDYSMAHFLQAHGQDLAVLTQTCSSVNHLVGSQRSLNGNGADRGRTLMEQVAEAYGQNSLLPNVNMSLGGYALHGSDANLKPYAKAEVVADAQLFPLALHRDQRIAGSAAPELLAEARALRDRIDRRSAAGQSQGRSALIRDYLSLRNNIPRLEAGQLLESLMFFDQARFRQTVRLSEERSEILQKVRARFPHYASDAFEAQAALSFLLFRYGLSTSVTMGLDDQVRFQDGPQDKELLHLPLAFDWSHNHHQGAQNTMWRRLLSTLDRLIQLLKEEDYLGDPALGKIWDRSLVYIASEFGRDRENNQGSGHHLNNGHLVISPLMQGNRVYGGVDPRTGLTFGYDPSTGRADSSRQMTEADTYSAVLAALGVSFAGQRDCRGMMKGA